MIEMSCHCGAVKFAAETAPADVTDCNCSICRRLGALWAYYQRPEIRFEADNGPTDAYVWNRRILEFHRCRSCGCVTHWSAVDRSYERMGVNARLMSPEILAQIPVSHFDGASA
ncbi:MAG: GFA family protein [Caulobacteraceae bacterium]